MVKKLLIYVFFLVALFAQIARAQSYHGPDYYFCVRIWPTWTGTTSYFTAYYDGRHFSNVQNLKNREFFLQIIGKEKSPANFFSENLFVKYGIYTSAMIAVDNSTDHFKIHKQFYPVGAEYCFDPYTELHGDTLISICYFTYLDSLWKLRYYTYPYKKNDSDTLGWTMNKANPWIPNSEQMKLLASYGMDTVSFIIFGEGLFKLLKDMNDPQWVAKYKTLGNGTDNQTSTTENR